MARTVSIGALRYDIVADTSQFSKAMNVTKEETKAAARAMRSGVTPAERYANKIRDLNNLRKKGLIDQKAYRVNIEKAGKAHQAAAVRAQKHAKALKEMKKGRVEKGFDSGVKSLGRMAAGYLTVSHVARRMNDQLKNMDQVAKSARLLGLTTEEMISFRLAGAKFAGLEARQIDTAIKKFNIRMGDAVLGTGEAAKALEELGLDARAIDAMSFSDAFRTIGVEMEKIESNSKKLAIGKRLFDDENVGIIQLMADGSRDLAAGIKEAREQGILFSSEQAAEAEKLNDALAKINNQYNSIYRNLALIAADPGKAFTDPTYTAGDSLKGGLQTQRPPDELKTDADVQLLQPLIGLLGLDKQAELNETILENQKRQADLLQSFDPNAVATGLDEAMNPRRTSDQRSQEAASALAGINDILAGGFGEAQLAVQKEIAKNTTGWEQIIPILAQAEADRASIEANQPTIIWHGL